MTITIDLVFIVQGLILAGTLGVANYIRSTRNEIRKLNGRLIKMEEWRLLHDKEDDEAHALLRREIESRVKR